MAIHMHDNATATKWGKGLFQVMIMTENASQPMGYGDGGEEDERELQAMAEAEGVEISIGKKQLKTGREVWTIRTR